MVVDDDDVVVASAVLLLCVSSSFFPPRSGNPISRSWTLPSACIEDVGSSANWGTATGGA